MFISAHYDPAYGQRAAEIANYYGNGLRFAHLHAHTTFSFLDGYGTPFQIAERLAQLGHTSCAITDHGNIVGHVPVGKALRAKGINPVYGCEFYICDDMRAKGQHCPSIPQEKRGPGALPHITVLAQTQKGYENLLALSSKSYREGMHYRPRIDHHELVKHQEGLVVLSGCPGGFPSRLIEAGKHSDAWKLMTWLANSIEQYFIEVTPSPGYDVSHRVTDVLFAWAKQLGRPVVMTADAHFPLPEDHLAQDLLLAVGLQKTVNDPTRELRLPDYQFYSALEDMLARSLAVCSVPLDDQIQAIYNAHTIAESCRVVIPEGKPITFPKLPPQTTSKQLLWEMCCNGLTNKLQKGQIAPNDWEDYCARLVHEIEVLSSKGFCDYMLAVSDVVSRTKERGGLVNLRGSAGGSLILWLLESSNTDPVKYDLLFERFYDETRPDPPDVDIDFEKSFRPGAIEYMSELYGADKVAQIAGLSQMKGKGALQNLCSGLGIPQSEYRPFSEMIDTEDTEEAVLASIQPLIDKYPQVGTLLPKVMGQYKTTTVHAAGVLVSAEPLNKCVGIMNGGEGQMVASVDKRGAAALGLLKMDFLNVQALDVVGSAAREINKQQGINGLDWLYDMIPNDEKVFEHAKNLMLAGVFQLDGGSAWKAAQAIGLDTFDDLVAASVLCRPGPAESIPIYRKNKLSTVEFNSYLASLHPAAARIVAPTFGVLMYQEQVMHFARRVAGMELKQVHVLRKGIGDKLGMNPKTGKQWREEWSERFISGCKNHSSMSVQEAEFWWHSIETHGGYSFNKSHGYSYGKVGYWMLWLKTYFPAQFYEAFLRLENDSDTLKKRLIFEFKKRGGQVQLLSPEHSRESFRAVSPNLIVGGYQDIHGIGSTTAASISRHAPFASWQAMLAAMPERSAALLEASRAHSPETSDPSLLSIVAPWLPVSNMPEADLNLLLSRGIAPCGYLTPEPQDSIAVGGYVTSKSFRNDKLMITLEDSRGMISARISRKNVNAPLGKRFRSVNTGDFIALDGWWAGDCLFIREFLVLRSVK